MHDIRLAIGLIAFVSIGLFLLTLRLLRGRSVGMINCIAFVTVVLLVLYVKYVWGQLWIVQWIPLPSVLVLSNWFPPLLGILAATTWLRLEPSVFESTDQDANDPSSDDTSGSERRSADSINLRRGWRRRLTVMAAIVVAAVYSVMYFIPAAPPNCGNEWQQPFPPLTLPVCIQTDGKTCSAAAAATLLTALGYDATEQEMAKLCLTKSGTTWLGLYHGLSVKLSGTGYKVTFFQFRPAELRQEFNGRPILLCCQLDAESAKKYPGYEKRGGWKPGTAHTVVYLGSFADRHVIGDPSVGYEFWDDGDLEILCTGEGLRIEGERIEEN